MDTPAPPPPVSFWVYILQTRAGSYYTGHTADLARRYRQHLAGRCRFTRGFTPVGIVACWRVAGSRGQAMRVEAMIKRWNRREKEHLVERPELLWEKARRELDPAPPIEVADPGGAS